MDIILIIGLIVIAGIVVYLIMHKKGGSPSPSGPPHSPTPSPPGGCTTLPAFPPFKNVTYGIPVTITVNGHCQQFGIFCQRPVMQAIQTYNGFRLFSGQETRSYLVKDYKSDPYLEQSHPGKVFPSFDLTQGTLEFDIDISHTPACCNAALFFAAFPNEQNGFCDKSLDASQFPDTPCNKDLKHKDPACGTSPWCATNPWYADGNQRGGWAEEFDTCESNVNALWTTAHACNSTRSCTPSPNCNACDRVGGSCQGRFPFNNNVYGQNGSPINTSKQFHFKQEFNRDATTKTIEIKTTLTQNGASTSVSMNTGSIDATWDKRKFFDYMQKMKMVFQLWTHSDWLGGNCPSASPCMGDRDINNPDIYADFTNLTYQGNITWGDDP